MSFLQDIAAIVNEENVCLGQLNLFLAYFNVF
jgi:hypothetical protein